VKDRLYQGPFPQYPPAAVVPDSDVVMVITPSKEIVPNYGHNWREVQNKPGKLDSPDWWQITFDLARRHNKRVGFRIMVENPDVPELGMPDFLMEKVYVKLKGEWKGNPSQTRYKKEHRMPRYDRPVYQAAFRELNRLLAAQLNGNPQVEYMDTMMYGFWGETHTWPFEGNIFPSNVVGEQTWMKMFETQLEVKGIRYPVKWACHQKTNPDGSLTLERNVRS